MPDRRTQQPSSRSESGGPQRTVSSECSMDGPDIRIRRPGERRSSPPRTWSPSHRQSSARSRPDQPDRPDRTKFHPDSGLATALEDAIYSAPVLEKPSLMLRLIEISRHNIGCLKYAVQQPDSVLMLLGADCYLATSDEARRRKLRGDVITVEEMRKHSLAQASALERVVEDLEQSLTATAGMAQSIQAEDRRRQFRGQALHGEAPWVAERRRRG